jgi:SAM-dependent methyltransferase
MCNCATSEILHRELVDYTYGAPGVWTMLKCPSCSCSYLNPRPTRETIGRAYASYYTHRAPTPPGQSPSWRGWLRRALKNGYLERRFGYHLSPALPIGSHVLSAIPGIAPLVSRHVRDLPNPNRRAKLLDIGCGNGQFLLDMRSLGWDVQGQEVDSEAAALGTGAGLPIFLGPIEEAPFENDSFDVITLSHLIEHVYDPIALVEHCYSLLRPRGVLWVATPNLCADGHRTFGPYWRGLEPPRHLVMFTPRALEELLSKMFTDVTRIAPPMHATKMLFTASVPIVEAAGDRTPGWRMRMALAAVRMATNPDYSEELVFTARRPAT